MKKHITDEKTGISYTLYGDYYLPDLELPEQKPVGIWGQQHLQYLKKHRKAVYDNLLLSGKLNNYLADIDKQADETFQLLVKQLADRDGITERLKATDQMKWVRRMNAEREAAIEIINNNLICI